MAVTTVARTFGSAASLPRVCARCGAAEAHDAELSLPYVKTDLSAWLPRRAENAEHLAGDVGFLFAPLGLLVLLHNLVVARRATLTVPLCKRHAAQAQWQRRGLRLIAALLGIACLAITLWAIFVAQDLWWFIAAAIAGFAALFARARMFDGFIYAIDVADDQIRLGGVDEEFARLNGLNRPPAMDEGPSEPTYVTAHVACTELPASTLPKICARCSRSPVRETRFSFWRINGMVPRCTKVWLPLCESHLQTAWWHQIGVPFVVWILGGVAAAIAVLALARGLELLLPALLIGVIAAVILARSTDSFIHFISANDEWAKLGGLEQRFAELNEKQSPG